MIVEFHEDKKYPVAFCIENGFEKWISLNRKELKGIWYLLAFIHESIHWLNPCDQLDEIYEKLSFINLLFKQVKKK